ncbi:hypothetical protein ODJ79_31070 [Actinoplanes sp. KI2]|uniref:hypothetical protein n=1 Tax=Actinoplanes sp. KI2 TaxID=2983315 RepID=UPI0021D5EFF9|nr:hypothetical protein [Actinoplanes sp. KI2]MCU7728181.1 hypothetical protein [Actinoplanes sp. KI2]
MTDDLEKLFQELRSRTLSEIVAPGAPRVRATVRRRFVVATWAGTAVVVAAILVGIGFGLRPGTGGDYEAGAPGAVPSSDQPPVMPEPSGPAYDRVQAAADLLADRSNTPTSINATDGVVSSSYQDDMNDMPADTYAFHFFCVGAGRVDVVVKQGDSGNTVLGQGTSICAARDPAPLRLTIRQPTYGYLRIFASGDARSTDRAGFAFEFLSTTGKTAFGPSGPPYTFSPSAGSLPIGTLPVESSPSN